MSSISLSALATLLLTITHFTTAIPLTRRDPAAQLTSIAPGSASCSAAQYPTECGTASQGVAPLIASFSQYSISTAAEQAALLSWMAYESIDFSVAHNLFPGVAGQGTYTMMSPTFVSKYAASIPAVAAQAAALTDPASILDLLIQNGSAYKWQSAAWFYSTQCSASVKSALQSGSQAGWEGFITTCVGTSPDEGSGSTSRLAYWQRATAALGV